MKLETDYLGLRLAHPVVVGASPLSATLDGIRRLEDAGAAAIVTASLYEEEILAEDEALQAMRAVGAESHPEVTGYLPPACGRGGPLTSHIETIRRATESIGVPLIASLSANTREGWTSLATELQGAGAAALELSFFHAPVDPGESSADAERNLVETVRSVCGVVRIPVAVKLGPSVTALPHLADALAGAGAGGIVLFNRFYEPDIDLETMTLRPVLELSDSRDIRLPLRSISLLAQQTTLSLGASGGVESVDEVVKFLLAGADAVLTASALLRYGPGHLRTLKERLIDWLEARGAGSVADIRGRLSARRLGDAGALLQARPTPSLLRSCPCRVHDARSPVAGPPGAHAGPASEGRG